MKLRNTRCFEFFYFLDNQRNYLPVIHICIYTCSVTEIWWSMVSLVYSVYYWVFSQNSYVSITNFTRKPEWIKYAVSHKIFTITASWNSYTTKRNLSSDNILFTTQFFKVLWKYTKTWKLNIHKPHNTSQSNFFKNRAITTAMYC